MKQTKWFVTVVILSVAMAVAAGGAAWAADSPFPNYVIGELGFYSPSDDLDNAGFDAGVNFSASYGRYITKYLIFEAGIGFFYTERDFLGGASIAGSYTRDDSIGVSPVTLSLKGAFTAGNVEFYGGGGVGGYFMVFNSDITASNLGSFSVDDDEVVLGAHVLAGANFNISPRFFIGVDGRYIWTDSVSIVQRVADIPVTYNGNLDGFTVNLTFGFRF